MTSFFLVRHGRTAAVGARLVGRRPNVPLDDTGRAQARALADYFGGVPLKAVYSSPLERTEQTARALAAPHGLTPTLRDSLVDIEFGAWTDKTLAELKDDPAFFRWNAHRAGASPPGGEHAALVQSRMVAELCRLRDAHPHDAVAVVGHADPLRAAIAFFVGVPIDLARRLELDPGSVTQLDLGEYDASLKFLNLDPARARAVA